MLKIVEKNQVEAMLHTATETRLPHVGLISTAFYKVEGNPHLYRIVWYNRHAPVQITADITTVKVADDAPAIWLGIDGRPIREKGGFVCARQLVVFAPKYHDDQFNTWSYYRGYSPLELAAKIYNERMIPCTFGDESGTVR